MPPLLFRRTNRALVVLVPLWLVGGVLIRTGSLWGLPYALVFAVGVVCALLCVEWLCLRAFQRHPALPFAEHASLQPRPWIAMGVVAILIMAAREHTCGLPTLDYESYTANTNEHHEVSSDRTWEATDRDALHFAGRHVTCSLTCMRADALCDAMRSEIACDRASEPGSVHVRFDVDASSPGCSLMPYFHDAHVDYRAHGSIEVVEGASRTTESFRITGSVDEDATGFHSCVATDAAIGRQIGDTIVRAIDDMLDDDD